jgi:hypothetical protein
MGSSVSSGGPKTNASMPQLITPRMGRSFRYSICAQPLPSRICDAIAAIFSMITEIAFRATSTFASQFRLHGGRQFEGIENDKRIQMDILIKRIRRLIDVFGPEMEIIHQSIVVEGQVSEEDFFLGWHAAIIMEREEK